MVFWLDFGDMLSAYGIIIGREGKFVFYSSIKYGTELGFSKFLVRQPNGLFFQSLQK